MRIQNALRRAAEDCMSQESKKQKGSTEKVEEEQLREMSEERRRLRKEGVRGKLISDISKKTQTAIRRRTQKRQDERIGMLLDKFAGLKEIAGIRGGGRKKMMTAVRRMDGKEAHEKQKMADAFAAFYENLYASRCDTKDELEDEEVAGEDVAEEVTAEEVEKQLAKMFNG